MIARSETPRRGYSTVTWSLTSWNASRSPVMILTSYPSRSACTVRVAITSSASKPSAVTTGTCSAASTSSVSETCPLNASGALVRLALYSGHCSLRKVLRPTSNATAMCVGRSSRRALMSIAVKPYTALVGWPVVVEKFSTGSA